MFDKILLDVHWICYSWQIYEKYTKCYLFLHLPQNHIRMRAKQLIFIIHWWIRSLKRSTLKSYVLKHHIQLTENFWRIEQSFILIKFRVTNVTIVLKVSNDSETYRKFLVLLWCINFNVSRGMNVGPEVFKWYPFFYIVPTQLKSQ